MADNLVKSGNLFIWFRWIVPVELKKIVYEGKCYSLLFIWLSFIVQNLLEKLGKFKMENIG